VKDAASELPKRKLLLLKAKYEYGTPPDFLGQNTRRGSTMSVET
jgi:hypothetical protein